MSFDEPINPDPPNNSEALASRLENRLGRWRFLIVCALGSFLLLQIQVGPLNMIKIFAGKIEQSPDFGRLNRSYVPIAGDPWSASTPLYQSCRLRVLAPLVAHLIYLRGPTSAAVAWLASLPAMFVGLWLIRRQTDAIVTMVFAVLLATIHPFTVANLWPGYQDACACLFILLAMALRPWWATMLCVFVGMLADERCIAGAGLVLVWHELFDESPVSPRQIAIRFFAIFGGFAVWILYAALMMNHLGLSIHAFYAATESDISFMQNVPTGFYSAFKAAWAVAVVGVYALWRAGHRRKALAVIAMSLPPMLCALTVADVTRVTAFAIPVLFLGVALLAIYRRRWLLPILLTAAVANAVSPTISCVADEAHVFNSLPHAGLMYLIHNW